MLSSKILPRIYENVRNLIFTSPSENYGDEVEPRLKTFSLQLLRVIVEIFPLLKTLRISSLHHFTDTMDISFSPLISPISNEKLDRLCISAQLDTFRQVSFARVLALFDYLDVF